MGFATAVSLSMFTVALKQGFTQFLLVSSLNSLISSIK